MDGAADDTYCESRIEGIQPTMCASLAFGFLSKRSPLAMIHRRIAASNGNFAFAATARSSWYMPARTNLDVRVRWRGSRSSCYTAIFHPREAYIVVGPRA